MDDVTPEDVKILQDKANAAMKDGDWKVLTPRLVTFPSEPTEEMSDAGARCIRDTFKADNQYARAQQIYRAMILAHIKPRKT